LLQLQASVGMHAADPLSYPIAADAFSALRDIDLSELRIGYTEDFGVCEVDADIRQVFRSKIAALRPFVKECTPLAVDLGDAHRCFDVIRAESFVAGFEAAYKRDPASLGPNTRANYELGAAMTLTDCAWAQAEQTRLFRRFQALFADYDLILAPTTPVSPFPWSDLFLKQINGVALENYYRWLSLTYVVTLATNPALSMPCGSDHKSMPFGLQLIGAFRADSYLLACASAFERLFDSQPELRRPRPDLDALTKTHAELTSIVTHPPQNMPQASAAPAGAMPAV
jgi:Asp-tRNA(Asn)/Glu-tRNA(Gln) amidotransferase A subunit family amidase